MVGCSWKGQEVKLCVAFHFSNLSGRGLQLLKLLNERFQVYQTGIRKVLSATFVTVKKSNDGVVTQIIGITRSSLRARARH